jgi:hypothetical protein
LGASGAWSSCSSLCYTSTIYTYCPKLAKVRLPEKIFGTLGCFCFEYSSSWSWFQELQCLSSHSFVTTCHYFSGQHCDP